MRLRLLLILFLFLSLAILFLSAILFHDCISLSVTTHIKKGVTLFDCQLRRSYPIQKDPCGEGPLWGRTLVGKDSIISDSSCSSCFMIRLLPISLRLMVRVALGSRFDHFLLMSSTSYLLRILATSLLFLTLTLAPLTTNISLGTILIKAEVKLGQQLCVILDQLNVFTRLCIHELRLNALSSVNQVSLIFEKRTIALS